MKVLLSVLFIFFLASTPTQAKSWHGICSRISTLAETIMTARQNGRSASKMMNIMNEELGDVSIIGESMILEAYTMPRYSTLKYQLEEIENFRDMRYLRCVRGLKKLKAIANKKSISSTFTVYDKNHKPFNVKFNQHGFVLKSRGGEVLYGGKKCDATRSGYGSGTWNWNNGRIGVSFKGSYFSFRSKKSSLRKRFKKFGCFISKGLNRAAFRFRRKRNKIHVVKKISLRKRRYRAKTVRSRNASYSYTRYRGISYIRKFPCESPNDRDSRGRRCGARSAYSRSGGRLGRP